ISATLDNGLVRIDSAHLTGSDTDIQAKGTFSIKDKSMNLAVNTNVNLAVLQTIDRDFSSSGKIVLAATVRGNATKPGGNGTLQLQNASVNYTQFPNGLSKANGTIDFSGDTATIRNLTGETGGGKLTLTGFALLASNPQFQLRATANSVRFDIQQGVSVVS